MPLTLNNLTKEFKRGDTSFKAVNDVSLSVEPGDFVCIIGRSGSGKSTLLNMVSGLLTPTSGSIEVDGQYILSLSDREASRYRNSKVGYVLQGQSALANLTVLDNVRLPRYFDKRDNDDVEEALRLLKKVGIEHLAGAYPRQLSGGELKRVSIARALINNPDYLIADEPTSDVDAQTTAEILELIKSITQKGTAVLVVTHELDMLEYGNRTLVMEAGVLTERPA